MASMEEKLLGKVAIITGSSAGIGAAIAIEFARHGAMVTLNGRDEGKLTKISAKCAEVSSKKIKPCVVAGDVTKEEILTRLVAETMRLFGKIDIVVNNAGFGIFSKLEDTSLDALNTMMDIHVKAPYTLTKLALPEIIKNKGNIINISSIASFRPIAGGFFMEYSMAKAAQDQFTQWMARELGSKGVRVNTINPGIVETDILSRFKALDEKVLEAMKADLAKFNLFQKNGTTRRDS